MSGESWAFECLYKYRNTGTVKSQTSSYYGVSDYTEAYNKWKRDHYLELFDPIGIDILKLHAIKTFPRQEQAL